MTKHLYVFTGAFDCGKTTTLRHLADHFGYSVHDEAHTSILDMLGDKKHGHPSDQPFRPISDADHICPMCRPHDFASLVLERQRAIEDGARNGDLLERGYVDVLEYYERNTGQEARWKWSAVSCYRLVFLFEEIPEVQRARWGKTVAERVALARRINERLAAKYESLGYAVVGVPRDTVTRRAQMVHERIESDRS